MLQGKEADKDQFDGTKTGERGQKKVQEEPDRKRAQVGQRES